jgi:haloalkane dehalogenase
MTTLLNDRLDVRGATVVVQDWGGPIGLRWAMENRDRVERIVILNTGLFTGRVSQGFMAWRDFAEKVGRELPVGRIIDGATKTELAPEVVAAYEAPFPGPSAKAGAAMFPLLVPLDADAPGAREMGDTLGALRAFDGPALVAFSDSDPIFPFPKSGQVFCDLMPAAGEQVRIEGAAHFLQEDAGEQIAEEIVRFLA